MKISKQQTRKTVMKIFFILKEFRLIQKQKHNMKKKKFQEEDYGEEELFEELEHEYKTKLIKKNTYSANILD